MSNLLAAQIYLSYPVICLYLLDAAFANDSTLVQDRHDAGDLPDELHVVLDDDDRLFFRQRLEQLTCLLRFFVSHPGDRFVDEEQGGVLQNHHADFKPLLLPVRQRPGSGMRIIFQTDRFKVLLDPCPLLRRRFSEQGREDTFTAPFQGQIEVFPDSQKSIDGWSLELSPDAKGDDFIVEAKVLRFGKATAYAETSVKFAASGELVAHAVLEFAF